MKTAQAGYSGTPLVRKLGIKPGFRAVAINPPLPYSQLVEDLPEPLRLLRWPARRLDFVHFFEHRRHLLDRRLPYLLKALHADGMIWVSWPKKSSGVATDITEDRVRDAALALGLVDVKVCAVDTVWSGLKLVIRKELRAAHGG